MILYPVNRSRTASLPLRLQAAQFAVMLLILAAIMLTLPSCSDEGQAESPAVRSVEIPSTLAGRRFAVWMDAHNSGSIDSIRAFVLANYSEASIAQRSEAERTESFAGLAEAMGGLYPRQIETSEELAITVLMCSPDTDDCYHFTFELEPDKPHFVSQMTVAVDQSSDET